MDKTQLQVPSVVASIFLMVAHGITAVSVTEKVLVKEADGQTKGSVLSIFNDIWNNILTLRWAILQIDIAGFPVLFFSTVWVGEIYTREMLAKDGSLSPDDPTFQPDATRAASRALWWSSILSLGGSILLPLMVHQNSFDSGGDDISWPCGGGRNRKKDDSFSTSVDNASAFITLTGFSWAVSQWVQFSLLGEAILGASRPASYDPVDDSPIPLTENRSRRHGHSGSGSAAERQQLMFNAEDQFGDDNDDAHHHQHRPRDSKDSG
ncbi:hypothetical protein FRC01_003722 [Tulasnella sp. 417]|nr:hypothetical protein FRC01_003722 [Tulasnella sp. 417]